MNLHHLLTNSNNSYSSTTLRGYISKLKRVAEICDKDLENLDFLNNYKSVIECLKNSNIKNLKDYYSVIIIFARLLHMNDNTIKAYQNEMKMEREKEISHRNNNTSKQEDIKQIENLTFESIQNKIKNYDTNDDIKKMTYKLILSLYFLNTNKKNIPNLVFRNDLSLLKIINLNQSRKKNLDNKYNYIVLVNDIPTNIIMMNYKTNKFYGKQIFNINSNLALQIKDYIEKTNKTNGDFLFGDGIKKNTFLFQLKQACKAILNNQMGVDLIRQLILTSIYKSNPIMTINEKNELARAFLHSSNVANEYIRPDLVS